MEEKNVKLKSEFKKVYIDTAKHAKDIEKWINSGNRKQGDIRRSIQRLEVKYQKLTELKKMMINEKVEDSVSFSDLKLYNKEGLQKVRNELELQEFEDELEEKTGMSLNQIEEKINELYVLSGLKSRNYIKHNPKYSNNIDLATDIPGNEDGLYYIEMKRKFPIRMKRHHNKKDSIVDKFTEIKNRIYDKIYDIRYKLEERKNKREEEKYNKNKKNQKVGRAAAFLMAGSLLLSGGITAGESNTKSDDENSKEPTNTYVDINKNQNEFKNSIYVQALEESETTKITEQPTTAEIETQKETYETEQQETTQAIKKEEINKVNTNSTKKEKKENSNNVKEQNESSDDVYNVQANTKYTEVSDGSGNFGFFEKNTKVKVYNRALLKTDENGNKSILNVTSVGQTWQQFAKENDINYKEFREYIDNNPNIKEMVSIQSEDGKTLYGWLSKDKLEKVEELER